MTLEEVRSYMGKTVEEIAAAALPTVPEAVSYTHLDVYKRQGPTGMPWRLA